MPDFDLVVHGADVTVWTDATANRLSPYTDQEMHRYRATVGSTVTLSAKVNGVEGATDSVLGGRLFHATSYETPNGIHVGWSSPPGQSSSQSFVPNAVGHFLLGMRHEKGGIILLHLDVEAA